MRTIDDKELEMKTRIENLKAQIKYLQENDEIGEP